MKLTIKNTQIAEAINLGNLKSKLAKKKEKAAPAEETPEPVKAPKKKASKETLPEEDAIKTPKEEAPRIRARSKSVFAESSSKPPVQHSMEEAVQESVEQPIEMAESISEPEETGFKPAQASATNEELRRKVFGDEALTPAAPTETQSLQDLFSSETPSSVSEEPETKVELPAKPAPFTQKSREVPLPPLPRPRESQKLGPTGKHIKDLLPPPKPKRDFPPKATPSAPSQSAQEKEEAEKGKMKFKPRPKATSFEPVVEESTEVRKSGKLQLKEFRDVKPTRRQQEDRSFDARDRQGLRDGEEDQRWRKKRMGKRQVQEESVVVRPTTLKVRPPISIKDLAVEMKLKSSQLISKLFLQGVVVTLNDLLDDETTIQLLGHEFGCEITIDRSEDQRIRITDKTVKEEIKDNTTEEKVIRPPVVAFMGHVDHGKTSLIDAIRKSNRASGEAGAITQHIGAFKCHTAVGDITILDTPGHEAFSAMRARGADVTDIVVLVVAGDEGIRQQTLEAIQHAKSANVTIVVAINKSDKPNFNPENVYRQLSENELLPEAWGGQTITINCSAVTGKGIKELLEMLALQAEILELKACPLMRARGTVLESEMHKGMGSVATVLVQNGTLKVGDALVFGHHWGRVKTMRNEFSQDILEAPPSTPVAITGLSGLPDAGNEFIVVKNEREAREIAEARMLGIRQVALQQKKAFTPESMLQQATPTMKKTLNLVLRADVQGSLEALRVALLKIESQKADLNIIFSGVGEVTESDIQLASTSKAVILGFHTQVESHADYLIKQLGVQVRLHDIIYHAIDDIKDLMKGMLDKIAQENDKGKAEVKALFKSSHAGVIAGCMVMDGTIQRNHHLRVVRQGNVIGKSPIGSLRRVKEDVKEVSKGVECGIVLGKFTDIQVGDILESYEVTYITQEL